MNRTEAHNLLNAVRCRMLDASEATITEALRMTGDIAAPETPASWFPVVTIPGYLNRSGRVMRSAGDGVMEEA